MPGAPALPPAMRWNSVSTIPGITSDTWMSGCASASSMRRLVVSELSIAFAALYAERSGASGALARKDETLTRCPRPRSTKCGTTACIP